MGVDLSGGSSPSVPERNRGLLESIFDDATTVAAFLAQGLTGLVTGTVGLIVGAITGVVHAIGALFTAGHRDVVATDKARAEGERAVVANMSTGLDQLDKIQRGGGAYMDYSMYRIDNGETTIMALPLTTPIPMQAGTRWIPPALTTPIDPGARFNNGTATRSAQARRSGQLELIESGLWLIFFQAGLLQGNQHTDRPADVFCHVTPAASPWLPLGAPGLNGQGDSIAGMQMARHRETGDFENQPIDGFVQAYGRAGSYIGVRDSSFGGGNTLFGLVPAVLPAGNWKVSLSCLAWERHSGPSTTYVFAYKVNSETLQDEIDQLKTQLNEALPGVETSKLLNEASIAAMVAQADEIEVTIPDE